MKQILLLTCAMIFFFSAGASAQEQAGLEYAGVKSCKKCHRKVFKSWEKSRMANAFDILKPGVRAEIKEKAGLDPQKDYTADSSCLPCHTTGYGKPGGFVSFEETPTMAGISCESCHGPGKAYNVVMKKRGRVYLEEELIHEGFNPEPKKWCVNCHNEKSPTRQFQDPFDAQLHDWPAHDPVKLKYHTENYQKSRE